MNFRMIKNILGWILLFEAAFLLIPLLTSAIYQDGAFLSFLACVGICAAAGLLLRIGKPKTTALYAREGYVIVSFSWIVLSLFGALPFLFTGTIPSFTDAIFETVSGFTTTGASILTEVESLPESILMWRSFTHWVGGMGVLVFIMAFVPLSGGQNMHIMKAESPGPSVSKLVPRVRTTALILYSIYFVFTVLEFILLVCGGMSVFEALNTAFATAGTGGFGFRKDSFASFSPYLQTVVAVFMVLFSINFTSYYLALRRNFRDALNEEVRVFLAIVVIATAIFTINARHMFPTLGEAIRNAFFTVATLISTTGFSTADFNLWPELSRLLVVILMFIGACAGSTGGGFKVSRLQILCKDAWNEGHKLIRPKQVRRPTMDRAPISAEIVHGVHVYIVAYLSLFFVSMVVLAFNGHDLITNFTATLATVNNIGPGLGDVGPTANFAFFSIPSKWMLIFNMLAGRLELFPMLLLFHPATWKK